uniref:HNH endonuclease n=1 Tax=Pithovirus LCPAC401 TaxID=2506595 RepID=A0A481ZCM7_9VIRU|nr:MAG: HNH endonuclease [Pithovirus LCPAC401]
MVICEAITKKGTPCKNKAKGETKRCGVHPLVRRKKVFVCTGTKARGGSCIREVFVEDSRCFEHGRSKIICGVKLPQRTRLCQNEVTNKGDKCVTHGGEEKEVEKKKEKKDERTTKYCPGCGTKEEWRSMKSIGFSNYEISSIGRLYNIVSYKLLRKNNKLDPCGYLRLKMSNDNKISRQKCTHTWQGLIFFDLKPLYGKETSKLSMDHIDRVKTHNWICCNLRVATKTEQVLNRKISEFRKCRTVLKVSLEEEVLETYISIPQAISELSISRGSVLKYCKEGKNLGGHKICFLSEDHIGIQEWTSSEILYPEYRPPFEVSTGGWIRRANKALTKGSNDGDYLACQTTDIDTGKRTRFVHDLVFEICTGKKIPEGYEISHINGEGKDNRLSNLTLDTHPGNMLNGLLIGRSPTAVKVRQIFHDGTYRVFLSINQAAKHISINLSILCDIIIRGRIGFTGLCKCGKLFGWEKVQDDILKDTSTHFQDDILKDTSTS